MTDRRLRIPTTVRRATEDHLTRCGNGRRECMAFWVGDVGAGSDVEIRRVIHPEHAATMVSTQMSIEAISEVNFDLYRRRQRIVAQLHTHPGSAFHSGTDDEFSIVRTPGFISIVLPDFGQRGLIGLHGCFVAEFLWDGRWRALDARESAELLHWTK